MRRERALSGVLAGLVCSLVIASPVAAAPRLRTTPGSAAVLMLSRWQEQRAAAYEAWDFAELRGLYTPGSGTGRSDVRLLHRYADRGLHVHGLRFQVFSVGTLAAGPHLRRLGVVSRLAGGWIVGPSLCWNLPTAYPEQPRAEVLEFHRVGGRWRLASVSAR